MKITKFTHFTVQRYRNSKSSKSRYRITSLIARLQSEVSSTRSIRIGGWHPAKFANNRRVLQAGSRSSVWRERVCRCSPCACIIPAIRGKRHGIRWHNLVQRARIWNSCVCDALTCAASAWKNAGKRSLQLERYDPVRIYLCSLLSSFHQLAILSRRQQRTEISESRSLNLNSELDFIRFLFWSWHLFLLRSVALSFGFEFALNVQRNFWVASSFDSWSFIVVCFRILIEETGAFAIV